MGRPSAFATAVERQCSGATAPGR